MANMEPEKDWFFGTRGWRKAGIRCPKSRGERDKKSVFLLYNAMQDVKILSKNILSGDNFLR